MTTIINASNGSTSGLITLADASGVLQLQTNNGTPALTLNTTQALGVGSGASYGTSGQVLTSAGSGAAPTWSTPSTGAMTLISTQTASSSASLSWTGLSTYDKYILIYENVIPAQSNAQLMALIGTGAGPTYVTSGYYGQGYFSNYNNGSGTTTQAATQNNTGGAYIGFIGGRSTLNQTKASGQILIAGTNSSTFVEFSGCPGNYDTSVWEAETSMFFTGVAVSASVTAIKIQMLTGNIVSGSFSLYGISS